MSDEKRKKLLITGVATLAFILIAAIVVALDPHKKPVVEEPAPEQPVAEPVTYELLSDMPEGYVFREDPMICFGMEMYTEALTDLYQKNGSDQQAVCMSLEDVLKEAGISGKVYREIMKYQGKTLGENDGISPVKEKVSVYDEKAMTYLLTSKSEDSLYYIGEKKNNRPNGAGALLEQQNGSFSLVFVGTFANGMKNGKGVQFSSYGPVSFVERIGRYEKGHEKGSVREYQVLEQKNMKSRCSAMEDIVDEFGNDSQGLFTSIYKNVQTDDPEAVILKWLVRRPATVYLDQPVLMCSLAYKGSVKDGARNGRGTLYDAFGKQIYKGRFKDGQAKEYASADNASEYPAFSKNDFLDMYHQVFVSKSRQLYFTETDLDEYERNLALQKKLEDLQNADSEKKPASTLVMQPTDDSPVIKSEDEIYDMDTPNGIVAPTTGYFSTYQRPGWIPEYRPSQYEANTPSKYNPYVPAGRYEPQETLPQLAPAEPEAQDGGTTVIEFEPEE